MKIEVGMYAKTDKGICKILEIDPDNRYWDRYRVDKTGTFIDGYDWIRKKDVLRASFNIIDLIEEGDYVNGDVVIVKYELNELSEGVLAHVVTRSGKHIFEDDVVSIVTKEQFENESYKIGDDK